MPSIMCKYDVISINRY